jgi:hypothetical protein
MKMPLLIIKYYSINYKKDLKNKNLKIKLINKNYLIKK